MADQKIKKNIDDQLSRLLLQLQGEWQRYVVCCVLCFSPVLYFMCHTTVWSDLEDMREDLDDDEYAESKADTLKQMEEFEQSLSKMMVSACMSILSFSLLSPVL